MINVNAINQLEILQCIICSRMFDTQQRKPMLICESQHSTCKQCFDNLMTQDVPKRKCPMCRAVIVVEKVSQFRALIEMRDAASKIRKDGSIIKKTLTQAQKKEQSLSEELSILKMKYKQLKRQLDATNQIHLVYIQELKDKYTKRQELFQSKIKQLEEVGRKRQKQIESYKQQLELLKQNYKDSLAKIEELQELNSYFMKQIQKSSLKESSQKKSDNISLQQEQLFKEVEQPIKEVEKLVKTQLSKQITTLKGPSQPSKKISKNYQIIDLSNQDLQQIDLSEYKKLRKLYLANNKLTQIDLGANSKLQHLNLCSNELESICLSNNQALRSADLSQNKLSIVFIRFTPDMSVELANQNTKNCDVLIDFFAKEEELCQKFIEEQIEIYRIGGNKWGSNYNKYQCTYTFQMLRQA